MLLVAPVFAFAQSATEAPNVAPEAPAAKVCPAQPKKCPKARPQISQEMREAFVQRILLSLSEEDLAKLAEKVSAVQKMTPEQKAEAIKALPKPVIFKKPVMKKRVFRGHHGKPGVRCCGPKCGKPVHPKMKKHRHVRRGPGIKSCCGAEIPPPPPAQPAPEAAPVAAE